MEENNEEKKSKEGTASSSEAVKAPQLIPYHFKKGQSGNPAGRKKGTMREWLQKKLIDMDEEERLDFVSKLKAKEILDFAEGPHPSVNSQIPEGAAIKLTGTAFLDENGNLIASEQTVKSINEDIKTAAGAIPNPSQEVL
jgi:hypothetical protein